MKLPIIHLTLVLSLSAIAGASTINFSTNAPSGSCFANTYNDASSGCQASGVSESFTNAQGDVASISWTGVTNSISFLTGPLQPVNYGSFTISYTANGTDTNSVNIAPVTFLLIVKEFFPSTIFYQPIVVDFTGTQTSTGSVGPGSADLEASFSPATVSDGINTTFFAPAAGTVFGFGLTNIGGQVQNSSATPEPFTWVLIATSIPCLLIYRRVTASRSKAAAQIPNA